MATVGQVFESSEAMYADDERRRPSREGDFGVHWTERVRGPQWRVTHIVDTDETYAECLSPWSAPKQGHIEIIGVGLSYEEVHAALGDDHSGRDPEWCDHCGTDPEGLGWVRKRLWEAMKAKAAR